MDSLKISFCFGFLLCLLTSCSTLKPAKSQKNFIELTKENLSELNGRYKRYSTSDTINRPIDLFWIFYLRGYDKNENDYVEFQVINERNIKITLVHNAEIVKSKVLKGKIENNRFEFHRRSVFYPFLLANIYKDSKIRVGYLDNNCLSTHYKTKKYGNILFFPMFETNKGIGIHERISD